VLTSCFLGKLSCPPDDDSQLNVVVAKQLSTTEADRRMEEDDILLW
jgi:hypothetical protein